MPQGSGRIHDTAMRHPRDPLHSPASTEGSAHPLSKVCDPRMESPRLSIQYEEIDSGGLAGSTKAFKESLNLSFQCLILLIVFSEPPPWTRQTRECLALIVCNQV